MPRFRIGRQAACRKCNQDIEYCGRGKWQDRGGGFRCLPYRSYDGEMMDPPINQTHAPDPNQQ